MAKEKSLMTTCKHCGTEIAKAAKVCPNCGGKNKKPIFKRVSFWIIILVVIVAAAAAGGGSDDTATDSSSAKTGNSDSQKQVEQQVETKSEEDSWTTSQKNAVEAAQNYVDIMAFSKKGLIQQLSSEYGDNYETKDAEFAVEHIDVNWKEEAVEAAENYLDTMSFSREGLKDQLTSEYGDNFTAEQAEYAVSKVYDK